jgi:ribonuclease P protein component
MRLPRERRIRLQGDFSRLRSKGIRLECGSFFLNAGPSASGSGPSRLGIVAAKAQLPLAVDRNRAKRLVRESFRACPGLFPDGWDVVIVVRKSLIRQPLPRLIAALRDGAAKAKVALGHG